jgi:tetratricopeptide (TPR) repeat protein
MIVRFISSRWMIVLLAAAVFVPLSAIVFVSTSGHAMCGASIPSPTSNRAAPRLPPLPESQPLSPPEDTQPGDKSTASQLDPQTTAIVEIEALKKESTEIAKALTQEFPTQADPLSLLGLVYNRHGQTAKAIACWQRALKLNPNRPDLYDAMATVALHKGEFDEAAKLCRKGLEFSDQMPHLHSQLVEALNGLGQIEESVSELQTAVRLFPDNGDFHCKLANLYVLLQDYEKAKNSYETAVTLLPHSIAANYGLARTFEKLGLKDEAQRTMEECRKLQAETSPMRKDRHDAAGDVLNCRRDLATTCSEAATVYMNNGSPLKAEPLLRRGAEVDLKNVACRTQLEQLLFRANRVQEALPVVRELVEIEPDNALFQLRLAVIYMQLERYDEARGAAKKAMELAPHNEECRRFLEQLDAKK